MSDFTISPVSREEMGKAKTPIYVGPTMALAREVGLYTAPLPSPLRENLIFVGGIGRPITASVTKAQGVTALLFQNCPDLAAVFDRCAALDQPVFEIEASKQVQRGTCRMCGCTMERACPSGCWWADETEQTLCKQHDHPPQQRQRSAQVAHTVSHGIVSEENPE
jgi:hypothetical protein